MPTDPILSALIHCALFTIDQIPYTFRLIVEVEADWSRSRRAMAASKVKPRLTRLASCSQPDIPDRAMTSNSACQRHCCYLRGAPIVSSCFPVRNWVFSTRA